MTRKTTSKTATPSPKSPEQAAQKPRKGRVLKRKPKAATPKASAPKKPTRAKEAAPAKTEKAERTIVDRSLADLRQRFCAELLKLGKSEGTARSYAADLKVAERHFGADRLVAKITRAEAEGYIASDLVNIGRSGERRNQITIDKVLRVFRQAMDHAVELGWVAASPMPPHERRSKKAKENEASRESKA